VVRARAKSKLGKNPKAKKCPLPDSDVQSLNDIWFWVLMIAEK
jgi:hypothetical protein